MNVDEKRRSYKQDAKIMNILSLVALFGGIVFYIFATTFDFSSGICILIYVTVAIAWHVCGLAGLIDWAKYKGRSRAWCLLMLLSLPGYIIAAIFLLKLPDKYYENEGNSSSLTETSEVPHKPRQPSEAPLQASASNQGTGQARFCVSCGAQVPDGARFCPGCGKEVTSLPPSPPLPRQSNIVHKGNIITRLVSSIVIVGALILVFIFFINPFGSNSSDQALEYNRQGVTLASAGKNDEAIAAFSQALQVYPNYPSAYTNRGIVYIVTKEYPLAIADFNNAIELNPDYALAYSNRALAYIYTVRYEKAVADLDKSLQIDPDDANVWNDKGVALEQLGELEEAKDAYDKALQLDPSNENASNNMQVLQSGGRPPGVNVNTCLSSYPPRIEKAWEGTTDPNFTSTEPPGGEQSVGGAGIQIKSLTGEWINDSPRYGFVNSANDGPSEWNYDIVLKLSETDPNKFTGSMQRTLRSVTGPAGRQPEFTSQIGQTFTHPVSGTRSEAAVDLYMDNNCYHLTFDGDYLYGTTTIKGNPTWTYCFSLKRK